MNRATEPRFIPDRFPSRERGTFEPSGPRRGLSEPPTFWILDSTFSRQVPASPVVAERMTGARPSRDKVVRLPGLTAKKSPAPERGF